MTRKPCRIVALAATKGGVGKTTLASALAVELTDPARRNTGHRVALMDSDPQESLAAWWDRRGSPDNPKLLEVDATAEAIRLIEADGWDWLVIDTPPAFLDVIEQAISTADFVLIPCRASALDILAVDPVVELCETYEKPFAFVLNAVQTNSRMNRSAAEVLAEKGPVLNTHIAQRMAYAAAMTLGKAGPEVERDGAAAREITALCDEVQARMKKRGRR